MFMAALHSLCRLTQLMTFSTQFVTQIDAIHDTNAANKLRPTSFLLEFGWLFLWSRSEDRGESEDTSSKGPFSPLGNPLSSKIYLPDISFHLETSECDLN